jgi:hypothetical protein
VTTAPGKAALWSGRILSGLVGAMMLMSAVMKLTGSPELTAGMAHLGLPLDKLTILAALELASVILYLIPNTAVLGAVLLTGYLGGAVFAHLRVGDSVLTAVLIGVFAWLALFLRDPRLRQLLPLRSFG